MMIDFLRAALEFTVILPGALLAFLPAKRYFRTESIKLALIVTSILLLMCAVCGGICSYFKIGSFPLIIPASAAAGFLYCRSLSLEKRRCISIILAVCGVFSCIYCISRAINILVIPNGTDPWFCLYAGVIYNLMCWLFVAAAWYPASHAARSLIDEEGTAQTWYVFWILPLVFIVLNIFMTPVHPELLLQGRSMQLYIVNSVVFLCLLCLFYLLFYLMSKSLNKNDLLRQENQFLSMQQTQYEMLCTAIEETRQARHDMRHHFAALSALAGKKEWDELEKYLSTARKNIPDCDLNLCDNPAVDGVAGHYSVLFKGYGIPFSMELDLPYKLPISDIDICLVMSNLLENALEASLRTDETKRHISVRAYLHSDNVVLICVENTFDGEIEEKNGIFKSSKRKTNGVGIQSIRNITEKNGGYSKFTYSDGEFCANIMLRGNSR